MRTHYSDASKGINGPARDCATGALSEAEMKELDELCIIEEAEPDPVNKFLNIGLASVNMKHVTAWRRQ